MLPNFARDRGLFPICDRFRWRLTRPRYGKTLEESRELTIKEMKEYLKKGINPFKRNKNYERTVAWIEHIIFIYESEGL
jgi:hypothetical protein